MTNRPEKPEGIETPGLVWRHRENQTGGRWELHWIADKEAIRGGYQTKGQRLWASGPTERPGSPDWDAISSECLRLRADRDRWMRGEHGQDAASSFDGTMSSLLRIYQVDPDSPFKALRYKTVLDYTSRLRILDRAVGQAPIAALTFRDLKRWYAAFRAPAPGEVEERPTRAHGLMTALRGVVVFGRLLELPGCKRLAGLLSDMTFAVPRPRTVFITREQVEAIRREAHRQGFPSIALAQALQFELMLRQKDVIGEWLPAREPGMSDVVSHGRKWLHGLHWRDISPDLILTKRISKSLRGRAAAASPTAGKVETYDLRAYPMVMAELPARTTGPLVVFEHTGLPWTGVRFNVRWRKIATAAGIPSNIYNKDSRAGGITEGRKAGATLEDLRHHAGHSQLSMTARYDRNDLETRNKVARLRVKAREE